MKFTKRILLALTCLIFIIGLDGPAVFIVQAFAWTKMAYTFGHGDSTLVALKKTFDGKHPCNICKRLSLHTAPQMKAPVLDRKILEYNLTTFNNDIKVTSVEMIYFLAKIPFLKSIEFPPPTPPPRAA